MEIKAGDVVALKTQSKQHITVGNIEGDTAVCYYFCGNKNEYVKIILPLITLFKISQ